VEALDIWARRDITDRMQFEEAERINKKWIADGKPAHDHVLLKETILGAKSGDKRCTVCGGTFSLDGTLITDGDA
jgi:hypothetical protein